MPFASKALVFHAVPLLPSREAVESQVFPFVRALNFALGFDTVGERPNGAGRQS